MMKHYLVLLVLFFSSTVFGQIEYVDPFIGVKDDVSNCVIGPQLPHGSINPSPHTIDGSHDGYHPDRPIRGFGQVHASGTGWGKYGQFLVSPQTGLNTQEEGHDSPKSSEKATAYAYSVTLDRYNTSVSVAPAAHSAIYQIVFPKSDSACVLFDLTHNIPQHIATFVGGKALYKKISFFDGGTSITGEGKYTGGFGGGDYPLFFAAALSRKPHSYGTFKEKEIAIENNLLEVKNDYQRAGGYVHYQTTANDTLYLKIAISFKSVAQAETWLGAEIPAFDYLSVVDNAKESWDNALGKIAIEGTSDQKKIFYTALYHAYLMPRDRTSDFAAFAEGAPLWDDHYAIWDTWRSVFPLMALIDQPMVAGNVNAFINRFKKYSRVRDAFIAGLDMMEEQGGNNIDNIIAEAWMKGIEGINWDEAYKVLKNNADKQREGWQGWGSFAVNNTAMASYKTKGWIPAGVMSCSKTLEYAYNDYLTSQVAAGLGKTEDAIKYLDRSTKWQYLWDPSVKSSGFRGFVMPRETGGAFKSIDPKKVWGSWTDYFYEGSSWTYSYFVPHEFDKLVYLTGGQDTFALKLEYGFNNDLIDYGNEPAFLAAYSFIYANRPDLAAYWGKKLAMDRFTVNGYPGNDDSGTMSAWYIFTTLGFFPNAGQNIYYLVGPSVEKSTMNLSNGKQLAIEGKNLSAENIYVQRCLLNGSEWNHAWITYDSIKNGANLVFEMGNQPSDWGKQDTLIYKESKFQHLDRFQALEVGTTGLLNKTKKNNQGLKCFHNPADSELFIQTQLSEKDNHSTLKIVNTKGQIVWNKEISVAGFDTHVVDWHSISPSLYLVVLENGKGRIATEKIVKSN
jgi:predicted alpha-1,2-mannosidase